MNETAKGISLRKELGHFDKYLNGKGLDIGAGFDPLIVENGTIEIWDLPQGDAQYLKGAEDNSYDFIYSSHCLEHMVDVKESLKNWARVVKPGGYLYIIVPDWERYELFNWPSRFNGDHKQSFSLDHTREKVGRDTHWNIKDLNDLGKDLSLKLIDFAVEDRGYDYLNKTDDQTLGSALAQIRIIFKKNE